VKVQNQNLSQNQDFHLLENCSSPYYIGIVGLLSNTILKFRKSVVLKLWLPNEVCETYCVCSVSYYYINPTVVGWCIAILRFFFTIILILILPHIFVRSISRRCLDQTLWNLVGISYAMWSWFFQNGCRCHGNGQNAK
jgi:hypothetical protein